MGWRRLGCRSVRVGFTGTREGMTDQQKKMVFCLLRDIGFTQGHHGDCVGADVDFHELCVQMGIRTVGHPPSQSRHRAYCETDETRLPRDYIRRNRDIINETDILIGCPKELEEPTSPRGSGTWSTIKHARDRVGQVTYVVWYNGMIDKHNG